MNTLHTRKRKVTKTGLRSLVMTGGNRLSVLVMGATVGGLLLLVALQSSLFWPERTGGKRKVMVDYLKGKRVWEEHRTRFLEQLSTSDTPPNLCAYLPRRTTAKKLWTNFIGAILAASQHPDDPNFIHQDWTKQLLSELPPLVLANTLHSRPPANTIQQILDIIQEKLKHPETAPPLRIAVLGGTFAEGEGCDIASVPVPDSSIMSNPSFCAWPYRLQGFLNTLMGGVKWVEVTNMSEEGTDTGFMTPLIRNWIYPKHLLPHGPDIIVNSYGRYDYVTYGEDPKLNVDKIIQSEMNTFLQAIEQSHPCGPKPLVVHMDDVGVSLDNVDSVLSIRHYNAFEKAMAADYHSHKNFAMAGHMAMIWVFAFDMLEATLQHCATAPQSVPNDKIDATCQDPSTGDSTCPFAFFAGPMGTVRKVPELQKYLEPFMAQNKGWKVISDMSTGWSRKTGLIAFEQHAHLLFKIPNIQKEVRSFHLMTLKSNGDTWKDGRARFRVAILDPKNENKASYDAYFDIDGYHDNDTDITYQFSVDLGEKEAVIGSDIMLSVEMLQGAGFKILGLMLCS